MNKNWSSFFCVLQNFFMLFFIYLRDLTSGSVKVSVCLEIFSMLHFNFSKNLSTSLFQSKIMKCRSWKYFFYLWFLYQLSEVVVVEFTPQELSSQHLNFYLNIFNISNDNKIFNKLQINIKLWAFLCWVFFSQDKFTS